MAKFAYIAIDRLGRRVEGQLDAGTLDAARSALAGRGYTHVEVSAAASLPSGSPSRLTSHEADEVVSALAAVTNADAPLGPGLRAAAAETANRRVAKALQAIARKVDQGQDLQTIMSEDGGSLPLHVRGLVSAACRTRRLGSALDDLIEHHRLIRDVWSQTLSSIAYPMIVLLITAGILTFLPIHVVPQFKKMFQEFELELPAPTQLLIEISDGLAWLGSTTGMWCALSGLAVLVAVIVAASTGIGTAWTQRFANTIPLLGPMWQWGGAAAFSRLLAMMLEQEIPLAQALVMAADGVSDPDIRQTAADLAREVENGGKLSEALWRDGRLPMTMAPFVKWGEQSGDMANGLRAISEILLTRVSMRAALMRTVSPPVVFIFVGLMVGFVVVALYMPLVSLISGLA
jgi:type II secretory pathway component PulF